jgi:hypothetical protein
MLGAKEYDTKLYNYHCLPAGLLVSKSEVTVQASRGGATATRHSQAFWALLTAGLQPLSREKKLNHNFNLFKSECGRQNRLRVDYFA